MDTEDTPNAITAVSVKGFKSFAEEQRVEIRPLTLLAGANSSGKSSALQPILLLKQTLEATYDPGPLLLDGPNVRFTSADQILTHVAGRDRFEEFQITIEKDDGFQLVDLFRKAGYGFELSRMAFGRKDGRELILETGMTGNVLNRQVSAFLGKDVEGFDLSIRRDRCLLSLHFDESPSGISNIGVFSSLLEVVAEPDFSFGPPLNAIIHVPGLRGNPERTYRATAVGEAFPGTFDNYVASVISSWQQRDEKLVEQLNANLEVLGLTWKVQARLINAAQVELLIGRLTTRGGDADDLVNIADVGFGVSQVLPVIVALLTARPGQLVYVEQPELHLHPRAQQAMASILADAARRGVRVVAETHSSILLLAVQSLVAEGRLDPDLVKLHWFRRDERGATQVYSTQLNENGAYGDWPEDFGEVRAEVENRYLNAVEARAFSRPAAKRARTKKK